MRKIVKLTGILALVLKLVHYFVHYVTIPAVANTSSLSWELVYVTLTILVCLSIVVVGIRLYKIEV